ncbi:Hypothetical predicted protein [Mytilus galloprovincialis]|uniref:Uncharacterized protein n=1 Tax=Mytilus galloprovincialis TaxID=29158 RepID=A0A8B6HJN1_MYTGA|nr:Hypothetical predicted protein [Mytilus galloprovincialis]
MMGKPTGRLSMPNSPDYARSVVGLQGSARINCAGPSMGNPVSFMPCSWKEGMTCLMRDLVSPVSNNASPCKIIPKEHSPKDVQDLKDQFHAFKGEGGYHQSNRNDTGGQLAISEEVNFPHVQESQEEQSHLREPGVIKELSPVPPDPTSTKDIDSTRAEKPIEGPEREPISLTPLDMSESGSQDEESGEEGEQTLCDSSISDEEGDLVTEGEREMITISQLTGGTMYRVPVVVQGQRVNAAVDTAAQVTLISEEMYKSLKEPPPILKESGGNEHVEERRYK